MDAKLHLANLLAQGSTIPEGAFSICVETDSVYFYTEFPHERTDWRGSTYKTDLMEETWCFDNPRVAYDTYTLEFSNTEFTLEEFQEWLDANPGILERQAELQQHAMGRLAELASLINAALVEGEALAADAGLPFVVNLGGQMQDVRKLAAVDWDSSSMYC